MKTILLIVAAIAILYFMFRKSTSTPGTLAINTANEWMQSKQLDPQSAKYSSYNTSNSTTLVGIATDKWGRTNGFVVCINPGAGLAEDGEIIHPGVATQHKQAFAQHQQLGFPMVSILRSMNEDYYQQSHE